MPAPDKIIELCDRFDRNIDTYKQGKYNETQVRKEFIDPFFKILGWDMDNQQGYAEAYKDVVHEDAIKIGGATKAPDYCFRIGGVRKFFLEAKKPSIYIKEDIHPAYQLRRYAWSAKLPLSVLTDFEEFAVYDCRVRPEKNDKAATARILYLTFKDYATRWDEIAGIFTREAILKGSFDKYVESNKVKKGTAEVDQAFLQEIERWRDLLAKNIALRNPQLAQRDLNFAVQRTIDRIIFLRICEDRGIEPYGTLMALQNGAQVYPRLFQLFYRADERYNSGLFHFEPEKDRSEMDLDALTPNLLIDDKVLKDIFKNLYYPDSPYEFYVLPADILGQVYEQFLGKVIRLTAGHRAVVETKPEVRKAGGVYYTPTYIVDYIVKQTVGKLLEDKTPGPKGTASKLRILDPACGSGSFLLGAYQLLLNWHRDAYLKDNPEAWAKKKNPPIRQNASGEWVLTTDERKRILLNNIYGVDIDPQAVEVTKLSLLLKVLEGADAHAIEQQMKFFQERALPDLSQNIKCGNSLIGPDFYDGQQLGLLDDGEMHRINAFPWEKEFAEIFENGGFDAVIGNPPYGAFLSKIEIEFLLKKYLLPQYNLDTYMLFVELGTKLLCKNGFWGMIIPNTWLLNLQTPKIRSFIFEKLSVILIRHFKYYVFQNVTVDTEIIILKNRLPELNDKIKIEILDKSKQIDTYEILQINWQSKNGAAVNIFERPEYENIKSKLANTIKLDSICKITQGTKPFQVGKGKPAQTKKILDEKPFVSEIKKDETFRPLLRGSLIQKWQILWNNNYWISFGDWLAEPRYSANYEAVEKIVIRQTGDSLVATLDRKQFIARDNLYTIVANEGNISIVFILGLINSNLINWYYQNIINPEKGEALAQIKRGHLAILPIPILKLTNPFDKSRHDQMVQLVERMLDLHQQLAAAQNPQTRTVLQRQIEATDRQIDQLVYALYELTAEEIGMVEGTSK